MITGLPQLIITGAGTHPHFMRLHFVITYIVWAVEFFREKSIYIIKIYWIYIVILLWKVNRIEVTFLLINTRQIATKSWIEMYFTLEEISKYLTCIHKSYVIKNAKKIYSASFLPQRLNYMIKMSQVTGDISFFKNLKVWKFTSTLIWYTFSWFQTIF